MGMQCFHEHDMQVKPDIGRAMCCKRHGCSDFACRTKDALRACDLLG
jgi:hypothetical protein